MADRDDRGLVHRINAMNPNQFELLLSLEGPGAPESLDEAVRRIENGEPVVPAPEDEPE